ncbi:protein kinase domain-containing protein [Citrus sinensis]|nr:protein kinase domain-containing protein [Citrus sinensis]
MERTHCLSKITVSLTHSLLICLVAAASKNITTDQKALLAPKDHITYAPTNLLTQNWTSNTSVCTGISITCDVNSHEVAALDISQFNLQGTVIPNTTGNLRNLKWLGLAYKLLDIFNFKIELSFLFGKLQKIKNLGLTGNPLDRILSGSIGIESPYITKLITNSNLLSFHGEKLQSSFDRTLLALKAYISYVPPNFLAQNWTSNTSVCNWIGITCDVNSHRVTALNISSLNLQGTIPPQLGNRDIPPFIFTVHKLKFLDFGDNQLSGSLSSVTFNLSSVLDIRLDSDKLSDEIPHEIGYLPNLENLVLGFNNLVGVAPAAIFNMSTVKEIYRFSGTIPSFITNASKLVYLDMGTNSFSGIIPNTIGNNLRNLDWLDLTYNCLTSLTLELSFLSSLTNCKKLRFLGLTGNPLDGVLPTSIDLEGNKLTGSIPVTFGRLQKLQGLYLPFNKLAGSIPDHLCHLARLNTLGLAGNKFSGSIPSCLGNLTSPRSPDLGSNRLTSVLPSTFWNLKDILFFDLSSNSLDGPLSLDIGNLKVVIGINLSRNNFSGDIPSTIGGLKDLQNISLACNGLEGLIPESFGYLTGLEILDLSNNKIFGFIPISFEKLLYLKALNLSFNKLEGEIPRGGPFANFTAKSFMGNGKLCGLPNLQFPKCKRRTRRKSKNKMLPLVIVLPLSTALIIVIPLTLKYKSIRGGKSSTRLLNDGILSSQGTLGRFSYQDLFRATDKFSKDNLIDIGSFGSVYRGRLRDGIEVAIKVFHQNLCNGIEEF